MRITADYEEDPHFPLEVITVVSKSGGRGFGSLCLSTSFATFGHMLLPPRRPFCHLYGFKYLRATLQLADRSVHSSDHY